MDLEQEFSGLNLGDKRRDRSFFAVMQSFAEMPGETIQKSTGTWARAKVAYRLLASEKFNRFHVMDLHRKKTIERMKEHEVVLAISDTSLVSYQTHFSTEGLGVIGTSQKGANPSRGLVTHNLIAVTEEGIPLGLLDQRTWARTPKEDRTQEEERESLKWVKSLEAGSMPAQRALGEKTRVINIGDRENDINEFIETIFCEDLEAIVRARNTRIDQLTGKPLVESIEENTKVLGKYELEVTTKYQSGMDQYKRETKRLRVPERRVAQIEVRAGTVMVRIHGQGNNLLSVPMNCVVAKEKNPKQKKNAIEWVLLTTLPVETFEAAQKVIEYYKARWFIEVFFRTLKSGCGIERSRLQHGDRLSNYILMMSIVAIKICMMTYLQRTDPEQSCEVIFNRSQWETLFLYFNQKKALPKEPPSIHQATTWVAQLGGFMARKSDGYPGTQRIWEGMIRLHDLHDAYLRFKT